MNKIVPASRRAQENFASPLPQVLCPLLSDALSSVCTRICSMFPPAQRPVQRKLPVAVRGNSFQSGSQPGALATSSFSQSEAVSSSSSSTRLRLLSSAVEDTHELTLDLWASSTVSHRPRVLLHGSPGQGQSEVCAAVLDVLEDLPVITADISTLSAHSNARNPEEAFVRLFSEACRRAPSIFYVPHVDDLTRCCSTRLSVILESCFTDLSPSLPVLVLASSDTPFAKLGGVLRGLFTFGAHLLSAPARHYREQFFAPLREAVLLAPLRPSSESDSVSVECTEVLRPVRASSRRRPATRQDVEQIARDEEHVLRKFRMKLRTILDTIMRQARFRPFQRPVHPEEAPDYAEIISNPICLEDIQYRLDRGEYRSREQFLDAFRLLHANCVEYTPLSNDPKGLLHRVHSLLDLVEHHAYKLSSSLCDLCDTINKRREALEQGDMSAYAAILESRGKTSPPLQYFRGPFSISGVGSASSSSSYCRPTTSSGQQRQPSNPLTRRSSRLCGEQPVFDLDSLETVVPLLRRTAPATCSKSSTTTDTSTPTSTDSSDSLVSTSPGAFESASSPTSSTSAASPTSPTSAPSPSSSTPAPPALQDLSLSASLSPGDSSRSSGVCASSSTGVASTTSSSSATPSLSTPGLTSSSSGCSTTAPTSAPARPCPSSDGSLTSTVSTVAPARETPVAMEVDGDEDREAVIGGHAHGAERPTGTEEAGAPSSLESRPATPRLDSDRSAFEGSENPDLDLEDMFVDQERSVLVNDAQLQSLMTRLVNDTEKFCVEDLYGLYAQLAQTVSRHRFSWVRDPLLEELDQVFQQACDNVAASLASNESTSAVPLEPRLSQMWS